MDEHLKTNEPVQDDLNVSERLEGSYILPGQPGYVPNSELRVHRLCESPPLETAEATSGKIPDTDPAVQTRELTGPAEDRQEWDPEVDRVKETVSAESVQAAPSDTAHPAVPSPAATAKQAPVKRERKKPPLAVWIAIALAAVFLIYFLSQGNNSEENTTDTANAQTEPAQQTEQTEQTEELAETEPAQEEDTAQEETEADDATAAAIPSLDAVPVDRPPGEPDTAEDLVGDWHGLVAELGHYGAAYEGTQPTDHDLIAMLDQEESTGKYFFEAYLPDGDSSVLSAYITMADDHFRGDIGEEDAWILNDYLTPDQNGLLYARYRRRAEISGYLRTPDRNLY